MEVRKRFKLYKSGKKWCVVAITTAATVLGVATATTANAQADSVSENPVVASASAQSTSSSSQQVMLATASESSATDSATSANVTNSASVASQVSADNETASSALNSTSVVSAENVEVSAVATVEAASSAVESSDNVVATSTSVQAVSSVSNTVSSSATISQEADSASAVREVASVATSGKKSGWVTNASGQKVYYNTNGTTDTGREYVQLPSLTDTTKGATGWYLLQDGVAQKGAQEWYGSEWYFDPSTYQLLKENTYRVEKGQKVGYLVNSNGNVLSGVQKWMGTYYYFDPSTNLLLDHQDYVKSQWGYYYMVGSNGALMTGVVSWQGSLYYFDPSSYLLKTSGSVVSGNSAYSVASDGKLTLLTGNQAFLMIIKQAAIDGWKKYGVLPSVTAAQAILESGWGKSTLATEAYNLFGIKGSYNGQSVTMLTAEYGSSGYYYIYDQFRKYPSYYQSIEDHGYFLASNSRYSNLLWNRNYSTVTYLLHEDGYATDPNYASSLNSVITANGLTSWDYEAFNS